MKRKLLITGIIIAFLAGLSLILYPTVSDWLTRRNSSKVIGDYAGEISNMTEIAIREKLEKARQYNEDLLRLTSGNLAFIESPYIPEDYYEMLNIYGIMGYIKIPKINVSMPIYHGTSEESLHKGAGHMENSSLPVGGTGNHAVLTGHNGLSSAKLFTDLDKLEIGDTFTIHVLNETLTYAVDQIVTVVPDDTNELRPVEDRDYVTLITCTPYAINSHRLLVRGERIAAEVEENAQNGGITITPAEGLDSDIVPVVLIITVFIVLLLIALFLSRRKRR